MQDDACLLLTGGEDCAINVSIFSRTELRLATSVRGHFASVRALAVVRGAKMGETLVFSGGGHGVLKCWSMQQHASADVARAPEVQLLLQAEWPTRLFASAELRVMDIAVYACEDDEGGYMMALACSDGTVRFSLYDGRRAWFFPVALSAFHDHCVQTVTHVRMSTCDVVLSTATDGRVAVWNVSAFVSDGGGGVRRVSPRGQHHAWSEALPSCSLDVHQSGVNCLGVHEGNSLDGKRPLPTSVLIATGGDDNSHPLLLASTW